MTIYLYVKTHNKTGLKYLGKTTQDPYAYSGSGTHWMRHLKKYGKDHTTEVLRECQSNDEVKKWGSYYSIKWDIVESKEWANLKPEEGDGGDPGPQARQKISEFRKGKEPWNKGKTNIYSKESIEKMRNAATNRPKRSHSEETKAKIGAGNRGKSKPNAADNFPDMSGKDHPNYNHSFKDAMRQEAKELYATGEYKYQELADKYNVSYNLMYKTIKGI